MIKDLIVTIDALGPRISYTNCGIIETLRPGDIGYVLAQHMLELNKEAEDYITQLDKYLYEIELLSNESYEKCERHYEDE